MRCQLGTHAGEPFIHWPRIRVQIDEEEPAEILDRHFCQADILAAESFDGFDVRSGAELAAKVITPGVIRACQDIGPPAALHQLVGAMLADIVESIDRAIAVHHAEQRFTRHLKSEIVARPLQLRGVACELPAGGEQATRLNLENRRVRVIAGIE